MARIRIGQVGLGRLGIEYARNLHKHVEQADLVAVCSLDPEEHRACRQIAPAVGIFEDYDSMLAEMELDAVVIVSSTAMHPEHILKALESGCHIFCEKPLAMSADACRAVEHRIGAFDKQIAMIGFNRRFDGSYRYAREQIDAGLIGRPIALRSQTVDMDTVAEFQLKFSQNSGGIFMDYNVHDIDLMHWFLGGQVKRVWSLGGAYKFPEFAKWGDADYVTSTCQLDNGTIAVLSAGRIATHGHDTYTEITGTEGSLRIGRPATRNLVEIYDKHGMRRETVHSFWERFEPAFLTMVQYFCDCVIHQTDYDLTVRNARMATEVAEACTRSFREGRIVDL